MAPNTHSSLGRYNEAIPTTQLFYNDNANDENSTLLDHSPHNLEQLPHLLTQCQWDAAILLIERYASDIKRCTIKVICQGETCVVSPLHFAVGTIMNCPIEVLESLVDAHPAALLTADPLRGLYPIHLGLMKGTIGFDQIKYLLSSCPEMALRVDKDGNLPLHIASEYATDNIIQELLLTCPEAAGYQTKRRRYAIHLLASSRSNRESTSDTCDSTVKTIQAMIAAHPQALMEPDLQGRLPLHLAACTPYPRWEILQLLCNEYPEAMLVQDENNKIPLQLLKRFLIHPGSNYTLDVSVNSNTGVDNDVVLTFFHDRTMAEKRKNNVFHKILGKVAPHKKKLITPAIHNPPKAIDLMNCYG